MENEPKDVRLPIMVTASEAKAIDDWRFAHRISSRAEAIRMLIEAGLHIPTLASAVTNLIDQHSLKDNPELASAAQALNRVIESHFGKMPK